jgi:hypothetical protein
MKPFTVVIYSHSMVLLTFCVIKQYYHSNYYRMAVNNHDKKFCNVGL